MMNPKSLLKVILGIVLTILVLQIVYAGYDDPGGGWAETDYSDEAGTGDDDWSGAEEAGAGSEGYSEDEPGYSFDFELRIYCHNKDRAAEFENMFLVNDATEGESHIFASDLSYEDHMLPFLPYEPDFDFYDIYAFMSDGENYQWRTNPVVYVSASSDFVFDNAKLHRVEGIAEEGTQFRNYGCIPYVSLRNVIDHTNTEWFGFDSEGRPLTHSSDDNSAVIHPYYYPDIGYDIEWDRNQNDCEAINGSWYSGSAFTDGSDSYRCCGDDRMWLYNRAVNQEDGFENPKITNSDSNDLDEGSVTMSSFCLYGPSDVHTDMGWSWYDTASNQYLCEQTNFRSSDELLEMDDVYEAAVTPESPYVFQGTSSEDETDIGKWSDASGQNPQFCYYTHDDSLGETYNWININTIGDMPVNDQGETITDFSQEAYRASTICEQYLGGKWTGSKCCGNKYAYSSSDVGYVGTPGYVDESYSETTPIYYSGGSTILYQYACLQGEIYDDDSTAQYSKADSTDVEFLNVNGSWYSCNADTTLIGNDWYTKSPLISGDKNRVQCDVMESYLCNYNPDTSSWEWYSTTTGEEGTYVKNTLRYSSGETFVLSTPVWVESEQPYACCAGYTCWDGTQCVDEYTEYAYEDSTGEEVVSICHQGTWTGALETKYDWYYNTDGAAVDYCVDSYACVCSSSEDDSTYCTSNEEYFNAGCTLEPNFYVNDHLCEQTTSSSQWTSRTKFLAFQLMKLAEGTDYILFCDKYSNTLNNYVDVEAIADDINSFCVLKQGDVVTIGVTFNSEDADEPMTVDADGLLFEGSNAFVDDILSLDVSDCDVAIEATQTTTYGQYFSCDGSSTNIYYNNILNAFIYSKDGLGVTTLTYPTTTTYQTLFDGYKDTVVAYIADEDITNPAGNDLTDEFEAFNYAQDYNRIYYNSAGIFGFEETKYDEVSGNNRYYTAVVYTGATPDCEQVYAPYETTANIHCNDGIVLERSTEGSSYWTSLTAGLRAE